MPTSLTSIIHSQINTNTHPCRQFEQLPMLRPSTPLLDTVDSPADIRGFNTAQLAQLADELREFLLYSTGVSGGHFGSNLGVVELTIALHHVFNTPQDQLVWDVGHQAYPHKILTGRRDRLTSIRSKDGLTAFPERHESEFDTFGVGHSSTAISAGLGMSLAMRHRGLNHKVISVVGDGAMTGGMAFEAMNDAVQQNADLIVVLNDNDMSISQATGGFSKHLATLWQRELAVDIDKNGNAILTKRMISSEDRRIRHYLHMANEAISDWTMRIPNKISEKLAEKGIPTPSQLETLPEKLANKFLEEVSPQNLFKAIGFQYFGPFDGHDVAKLVKVFERVKQLKGAVLVHVHTVKGKGFLPAEGDPITYHAIGKLPKPSADNTQQNTDNTAKVSPKKYSDVFGEFITDKAETDHNLMAITPAMAEGSGMVGFAKKFPKQFFDVAIAEQHAVTLAGGMATQGVKPIVAIYSTFLQRGYDQLIHDVALQNLDVTFAIDRAGLVGEDGATHAGVFDIAFMRTVPNMVIATPKDENECYNLLNTCYEYQGSTAVRYPRGTGVGVAIDKTAKPYPIGKAVLEKAFNQTDKAQADKNATTNPKIALLVFGTMTHTAIQACEILSKPYANVGFSVYNMRFVKPLDTELLDSLLTEGYQFVTLEEHQIMGGAGSAVNEYLLAKAVQSGVNSPNIVNIGISDAFIPHGSHAQQLAYCGLDVDGVVEKIKQLL
ncbi:MULTISPECIES: 1-deoxy-D-xylulose-5-phosphate synthase [unclassified Moraxella]|uniref:1-deoxy-D-xylulose-5-phosphate synthase n=1 Tax=unclassified Moraxella TaxID=2685852 RepID=UPI003AF6277F